MNRDWKRKALVVMGTLVMLTAFLFMMRSLFFDIAFKKVQHKLSENYSIELAINDHAFVGFRSISLNKILLKQSNHDTLAFIDSMVVQIKITDLLKGQFRFNRIVIHQIKALIDRKALDAFSGNPSQLVLPKVQEQFNFVPMLNRLSKTLFSVFPEILHVEDISISVKANEGVYVLTSPYFDMQNNAYRAEVKAMDPFGSEVVYQFSGNIDPQHKKITSHIKTTEWVHETMFRLPYGLALEFDTLQMGFEVLETENDLFACQGTWKTYGLGINHTKLASETVYLDSASLIFNSSVDATCLKIDSNSVIRFNKIAFSPFVNYQYSGERWVHFNIMPVELEVQDLIQSFPDGMFESTRDIKATGNLQYSLNFYVNLDKPDSIIILSNLRTNNLNLERFGKANLFQLADTFTHQVYDNGYWVRSITLGEINANYTPLDEISPFLKNSVLTAEDGGFFYHKGFDIDGFKLAISENLKAGRFVRGGSTITMQLVKNLYLNQQKTLSRKLEEVMLVWMLENMQLTSKDRMFEVYLNIIEWAPGIYGISEASEFYFNKKPSQLTLNESIYLASVIPSPKNFRFTFNKEGNLRDYYAGYYRFLISTMLMRDLIGAEDTINLVPDLALTGKAFDFIAKPDTVAVDTLIWEEFIEF
jgi:hypothetical protein